MLSTFYYSLLSPCCCIYLSPSQCIYLHAVVSIYLDAAVLSPRRTIVPLHALTDIVLLYDYMPDLTSSDHVNHLMMSHLISCDVMLRPTLEEIQSAVIEATAQTLQLEYCREANMHCIRLIQTVRDKDMYVGPSSFAIDMF